MKQKLQQGLFRLFFMALLWGFFSIQVAQAQTFTSFGSASTSINSNLVINGTNLTGTTSLMFGETPARFTVDSDTQITATVPRVANSGPLRITNPTGSALSTSINVSRQSSSSVFSLVDSDYTGVNNEIYLEYGNIGLNASPTFTDLDGDGLLDMIVGYGDLDTSFALAHYEQSAANSTSFTLVNTGFANCFSYYDLGTPTFTDLDGDGLLDMIVGKDSYISHYEQNTANSTSFTLITEAFNYNGQLLIGIRYRNASPTFTDLDGDGLLDLIIGSLGGIYHYEQNVANSTSFTRVSGSPLSASINVGLNSAPTVTDLDGDGLLDMIVGKEDGTLSHYEQTTANSYNFTLTTSSFNGIDVGLYSKPTFTDIDGDGLLDMIVGKDGGLSYYGQDHFPIISAFSTNSACLNAVVSITGTGFTGATSVTINGTSVGTLSDVTATNITFTAPANVTSGNVVVTTPHGSSDGVVTNFNYPPTFTSFGSSSTSMNSSLVINGTNLTGTISVRFGETPAKFTVNSSTQITAIVPSVANSGKISIYNGCNTLSATIPITRQSSSNVFGLVTTDFNGVNVDSSSKPAFTDLDGDDLLDMIVGKKDGTLSHYEQSTANSTNFTLRTTAWNGIDTGQYSAPTFTDLDGDGLLDMIVASGTYGGRLSHYEQNAANSTSFTLRTVGFNNIDFLYVLAPTFTDLDGDGLLDMLVGMEWGTVAHYEQDVANSTSFTLINDNFNFTIIDYTSSTAPTFTDLDGDGLLDMIIGTMEGSIKHLEQNAPNSLIFELRTHDFNGIDSSGLSAPIFTDLDGDGLLDMIVGNYDGTLSLYEQEPSPVISTLSANSVCQGGTVSITGTNFSGATSVTINGTDVGALSGVTATNITFTLPANATSGNVVVTTPNGTSNAVSLTVDNSVAGTVSSDQLVFIGTQPANITLTGSEGTVQWQSSLNNSTFADIAGATGTTLTGTQMGALTTKRYYRAVVTSGSCASVTSGVVTVTVVASTKVKTSQCGKTLASIESTLSADVVVNANKYLFEISKDNAVVQELPGTISYIRLTSLTAGAQYETTYSIRVKTSSDNGVTWSNYGTACSVTTPAPTTKVQASQCGKTLALINSNLLADVVMYANQYQFEISKDNSVVQELTSSKHYILLTNLTAGAKYGTTYSIRVKTSGDNGVTWSKYGASCSVTTPAVPVTKVKATQCGTTLASIDNTILADVVLYANKYQFEISKDNSVLQELTSTTSYTRLTNLTAGAKYGTTYSIRVKTSCDNGITWSIYGAPCTVTTPAAPLTKIKATQCGQNLALINSILSADVVIYANKYRFEISKNNSVVQELTSTTYYTRLTSLTAGAQYGTTYSIRVKTSFDNGLTWSVYGSACTVITPSAPLTRPVDSVTETELATFKVTGYPNPYTNTFKLDITTQSSATVEVMVYDMIGKLIEVRNSGVAELGTMEIGDRYATGVYNVIVTQGTEVKTVRMIKK